MYETNLLRDIPNQKIIEEIFAYCPIELTLKLVKCNKGLQTQLSITKQTYSIYTTLLKKSILKYNNNSNTKDIKPAIKDLMLSSLFITNTENLYQSKDKSQFILHTESIYAMIQLSHNIIATGSKDKKIQIWDIKQSKCIKTLTGHTSGILALFKLFNYEDLLSASFNSELLIWSTNDSNYDYRLKQPLNLNNKSGLISIIQYDSNHLIMSHWDLSLELYDITKGRTLIELKPHSQPIIKLAHLISTGSLITFSRDQTCKLWIVSLASKSLQCTCTLPMKSADDINKYITSFMENESIKRLALGYSNGSIVITNTTLNRSFNCVKMHSSPITSIITLDHGSNCACIGFNEDIILIIDMINTESKVIINTKESFDYMLIQLKDNRLLAGVKHGYIKLIGINSEDYDIKLSKGDVVFKKRKVLSHK